MITDNSPLPKEVLDISNTYYISKSDGSQIRPNKKYKVLNLFRKEEGNLALEYAKKVNTKLYTELVRFINRLDTYLHSKQKSSRYGCYDSWLTTPEMTDSINKEGLYGKYIIKTLDGNPIDFPAFVFSMTDPIVLQIMELNCLPL